MLEQDAGARGRRGLPHQLDPVDARGRAGGADAVRARPHRGGRIGGAGGKKRALDGVEHPGGAREGHVRVRGEPVLDEPEGIGHGSAFHSNRLAWWGETPTLSR